MQMNGFNCTEEVCWITMSLNQQNSAAQLNLSVLLQLFTKSLTQMSLDL